MTLQEELAQAYIALDKAYAALNKAIADREKADADWGKADVARHKAYDEIVRIGIAVKETRKLKAAEVIE